MKAKILGPVNSPIYKIRGKYRNRILIRSVKSYKVQDFLSSALKEIKLLPGIKLTVDVDPINLIKHHKISFFNNLSLEEIFVVIINSKFFKSHKIKEIN